MGGKSTEERGASGSEAPRSGWWWKLTALFMGALIPTGYMNLVKTCELFGGILVAIPLTRNIGLLFLGPVVINILAFHIFITGGQGLFDPMLIVICLIAAYLLWDARAKFSGLLNRKPTAP